MSHTQYNNPSGATDLLNIKPLYRVRREIDSLVVPSNYVGLFPPTVVSTKLRITLSYTHNYTVIDGLLGTPMHFVSVGCYSLGAVLVCGAGEEKLNVVFLVMYETHLLGGQ